MINWKTKLTSRKFWLALAGLFVGVLALFQVDANTTQQISGVIMSLGSVVAYVVGEGLVDAASAGATVNNYDASTAGQQATTPPSTPAVDTVDTSAADGTPTGAAQAAETKTDTALPSTPAEPQDGADGKTDAPAAVTPQAGAEDKSGADVQ